MTSVSTNLIQYTSPVGEYTTMTSYDTAVNMTNGFLQTLSTFNIQKEGSQTDAPLFITYSSQSTFTKKDFIDIVSQLKSSLQQFANPLTVVDSHDGFNTYSKAVVMAICKWQYSTVVDGLKNNINELPSEFKLAINYMSVIGDNIVNDISNVCLKSMETIAKMAPSNQFLMNAFFRGGSGLDATKQSFRYQLREAMLKSFNPKLENVPDTNTLINLKHILLDLFIISYYPYVHWMYITALLDMYKKSGNFRLMREAVFARATFVMYTLISLYDKSQSLSDGSTEFDSGLTSVYDYIKNIHKYIQNLTNIQFGNDNYTWSDVINEVNKVSVDVSNKSTTVQQLKEQIKQLQLQIRANIDTYKSVNGVYEWRLIQYKLLVVFIIFFIVIVGVLYSMNVEVTNVMYGVSAILAIFVLQKLVQYVILLIK